MTKLILDSLTSQLEASLAMLHRCIAACPPEHFDDKIGNDTFRQVAYHTLFFFDFYLSPSESAFQLRDLHKKGGDERGPDLSPGLYKEDALALLPLCRQQIATTLNAETEQTLAGSTGFSRRKTPRLELHIYNIRHTQHHVGQLSALPPQTRPQDKPRHHPLDRRPAGNNPTPSPRHLWPMIWPPPATTRNSPNRHPRCYTCSKPFTHLEPTMKRQLITTLLTLSLLATSALAAGDNQTVLNPTTIPATSVPAGKAKVALIKLTDELVERPKSFQISLSTLNGTEHNQSLASLIVTLDKAKKDPNLAAVFLDLSAFSLTLNQSQELGTLVTALRHAGKRVAVYSSDYDTATYVLASYADTVIMPENGNILIPGVGLQMVFFKGTLDKLNLQPDFVQIGKYKGAEEPFMRTTASDEYRAQINKLVDGMYSELLSTISTNRPNLDADAVKKAIDEAWLTGKHAKEIGLVDQTLTRDKVDAWFDTQFPNGAAIIENYGKPKSQELDMNNPFALFSLFGEKPKPRVTQPAIAVIYAVGEIVPDFVGGEDSTEMVTPAGMRSAVEKALKDDNIKAIVLRVDSPGGSASASDEIWSVLHDADKKRNPSPSRWAASLRLRWLLYLLLRPLHHRRPRHHHRLHRRRRRQNRHQGPHRQNRPQHRTRHPRPARHDALRHDPLLR